jgi:hypothetical protein
VVVVDLLEAPLEFRLELLVALVGAGFMVVQAVLELLVKEIMVELEVRQQITTDAAAVAALVLLEVLVNQTQAALEGLELPHQLAAHL